MSSSAQNLFQINYCLCEAEEKPFIIVLNVKIKLKQISKLFWFSFHLIGDLIVAAVQRNLSKCCTQTPLLQIKFH